MKPSTSPIQKIKSISESFFDVIETLCGRFFGLSPLEVMNSDIRDVYDLYVDTIIHDYKGKDSTDLKHWVTSKNATWH